MTRTQYYVASSLDGFIADASGRLDWLFRVGSGPDVAARIEEFVAGVGALAMGRATYRFFLDEGVPWPYGDRPTWVFTHRQLPAIPGVDVRFCAGDVAEEHRHMCDAAEGRNVWVVGGGNLAAQFAERGLLDDLWWTVAPVLLGEGAPLLPTSRLADGDFELQEVTRLGVGLVELRYRFPPNGPQRAR